MPEALTREQLGELAAMVLDALDQVDGDVIRAGFVMQTVNDDGVKGILSRTTDEDAMRNIVMFHDAATLEFTAFARMAKKVIEGDES